MEKLSYRILLLVLSLGLFGCDKSQVNVDTATLQGNLGSRSQIVGGKLVTATDSIARSVVLIYILPESGIPQTCTGSFITKQHILTAAHCVSDIENMSVTQGLDPMNDSEMKVFKIKKVLRHFSYDENKNTDRNDIAIITIEENDSVIQPVKLPTVDMIKDFSSNKPTKLKLKSLGYGLSQESSETPDYKLRQVQMKFSSQSISNEWMADQETGHGVCFGDSGGPIILQNNGATTIVGVASGVQDNCHSKSVFMNVFYYLDWIVTNTSPVSE